jgi:hypothetical protein
MNEWTAVVIIVALLIVGAIAWMFLRQRRTGELRRHFGPEYDHELQTQGGRRRAEAELEARARRVKRLAIRPLPPAERTRYAEMWKDQQSRFVDDPTAAVDQADHLVEEVMQRRGYPVNEFEQQAADISVDHPQVVENYRAAHAIALRQKSGQAGTEDLRKAMIYYRTLFQELLEDTPTPTPTPAPAR